MNKKWRIMKTILIITTLFINTLLSQDYEGNYDFYFLDRTPNSQNEAMGRGGVALHGNASSAFFNPANIGTITDYKINYTYSSSYYLLEKSQINYFAAAFPILDIGTIALTYNLFDYGFAAQATENELSSNSNTSTIDPYLSNIALTYAYSFYENFYAAFTVNYFTEGFSKSYHSLNYDFGLLMQIETDDYSNFNLGLSVKNIFNQKIEELTLSTIHSGDDRTPYYIGLPDRYLPVQMRFGLSFKSDELLEEILSETKSLGFLVHSEIQTVLNSDFYDAFRIGAEINLFEIISIRTGYFYETRNDYGHPEFNDDYIEDYTYGIGLHLDFNKYLELPFSMDFDYTNLKQYTSKRSEYYGLFENYSVISLGFNWVLPSQD